MKITSETKTYIKIENYFDAVTEIADKFRRYSQEKAESLYFELLYIDLQGYKLQLTEKQKQIIPDFVAKRISDLSEQILKCTSAEFKQDVQSFVKESSQDSDASEPTKQKRTIGFTTTNEYGLY